MLDAHVLVLNRNFQPISVVGVRRAFVMLYLGVARALDREYRQLDFPSWAALSSEFHDETVGTSNRRICIPRVLVLQVYDRVPVGRIRFSRHNIFVRDDHQCQYCGKKLPRKKLNLDHVIPRSRGGKTNWENVVASCFPCNQKKGGHNPQEAGMRLIRKPKRPRWSQIAHPPRMRARYREWLPFLDPVDASYWNAELETDDEAV
ncbi:MAG: HNH endonuclease [Deltaproteobacteria bacterium RIFOXYA12_FULL_58_15]|nr:MAG: HNH endonuclease [Deltaproteobacteria bacterium RIFOXYA12_FULL_58_15]OGR09306.1 MAG: HNH endonuclease [Deltaproteobacteria bacterium RIFOXYB12_FULL_58_9]